MQLFPHLRKLIKAYNIFIIFFTFLCLGTLDIITFIGVASLNLLMIIYDNPCEYVAPRNL